MKFHLKIVAATLLLIVSGIMWQLNAQSLVPKQDAKKGTWGYVSSSDRWVVKPKYDKADGMRTMPNGKTRAIVSHKGKQGFLDENGKPLGAGIIFEKIEPLEGDAMFVTVKGKKGVVNYDGQYLVKPEIDNLEPIGQEGFIVTIKGKKGILCNNGTFLLNPLYKNIDTSLPDLLIVDLGGKSGLLSRDAKKILIAPKEFTKITPFSDLWKIYKGTKVGLYNLKTQSILVKPEYEDVRYPLNLSKVTLIPVADKSGSWGVVTSFGQKVVKNKFTDIVPLESANALLLYDGNKVKNIYFADSKKPCKVYKYETKRLGPYKVTEVLYNQNWRNHVLNVITLPDGRVVNTDPSNITVINNHVYLKDTPLASLYDMQGNVVLKEIIGKPKQHKGWLILDRKALSRDGKLYDLKHINDSVPVVIADDGLMHEMLSGGEFSSYSVCSNSFVNDKLKLINRNGQWGVSDGTKDIIECKYDSIKPCANNSDYWVLMKNGKAGLYNMREKEFFLDEEYDSIDYSGRIPLGTTFTVYSKGKVGLAIDIPSYVPGHDKKWAIPLSMGYDDIFNAHIYIDGNDSRIVGRNGKYGVAMQKLEHESAFMEVVPTLFDRNKIELDGGMIVCTSGAKKRYFDKDGKEHSVTPRVVGSVWSTHGKTYGGYNASFMHFDLTFHYMKGKDFTIYCDVYNSKGKRIDRYSDTISPDTYVYNTSDLYFTIKNSDLPVAAWSREDFKVKFRLIDNKTGKEVPIKGNKTLSFWVRRG